MDILPNAIIVSSLKKASRILTIAVILTACAVIAGWIGNIAVLKSIEPNWPTMKMNTAIAFIMGGASLLLLISRNGTRTTRRIGFMLALAVFTLGAFTLMQDIFHLSMGLDQFILEEPSGSIATSSPGRMPPMSSLNFILIGIALLYGDGGKNIAVSQFSALTVHILSILGLTGYYLYNSPLPIPAFALSAFHATIAFLIISLALLFSWSDRGLMAIVTSDTIGGSTARRLLPAAIATPIFLGWMRFGGNKIHLYSAEVGMSMLIVSIMVFLILVIWWNANIQTRIDMRRREQEIRTRENEAMVRNILELLPVGVSITDIDGNIVLENPANSKLWNSTFQRPVKNFRDYAGIHLETQNNVGPDEWAAARALAGAISPAADVLEITSPDGSRKNIINAAVPYRTAEGRLDGAIIVNEDVTELRRAQQSLEKQAQIFNLVYDAIIARDFGSGTITYWNRGAEELYGLSAAEAVGKNSHMVLQREFIEPLDQIESELLRNDRWEGEIVHHRPDGKSLILLSRWTLERDRAGRPSGILEINYDLTVRKNFEEALQHANEELELRVEERTAKLAKSYDELLTEITERVKIENALGESQEMYSLLAENIPELVWMAKEDGYVEYCNRRWYDYTGTDPNIPLGRGWEFVIHPEDLTLTIETWTQSVAKGIAYDFQCRLKRADGAYRWHIIRAIPWRDGENMVLRWFGTCTDIDEQKQSEQRIILFSEELEQRVARRTEELTKANRELEAFTYSVSHDLRAPIRHINGFIKMLQEDIAPALNGEDKRHLSQISDASHHMGLMIDDLLAFSRLGRAQIATTIVHPSGMIHDIIQGMEQELKGRTVHWIIKPLPVVNADPSLLKLALTNLLSNAIKYTSKRVSAHIEIGSLPKNGKEETFYIRDDGVGFDMQYADKLFGVFQRLHPEDQFEGIGIGLANTRRIIEKHGGRIWAEGKPDGGAVFYFTLPAVA